MWIMSIEVTIPAWERRIEPLLLQGYRQIREHLGERPMPEIIGLCAEGASAMANAAAESPELLDEELVLICVGAALGPHA